MIALAQNRLQPFTTAAAIELHDIDAGTQSMIKDTLAIWGLAERALENASSR